MLRYLQIFSWFLFTFGVVGALVVAAGLAPDVGSVGAALGVMTLQTLCAGLILFGFRLYDAGRLSRNVLLYGGWAAVAVLLLVGQVWLNASGLDI